MSEHNNSLLEGGALPRKVMTLFMLIDTSGSMTYDGNIDKVNRAVENTIQQLRDISDSNFDAEIRVAILTFGDSVRWETAGAVAMEDIIWNDLSANGLTPMGAAFSELESKLSRSAFLQSSTGAYAPVIMLLSDGQPTDSIDEGLAKLKKNNWYRVAAKVAIAVNDEANDVLVKFTGNTETVIRYDSNKQDLQSLLTNLAKASSKIQSRSRGANELGTAAEKGIVDDVAIANENAIIAVKQAQEETAADGPAITEGW